MIGKLSVLLAKKLVKNGNIQDKTSKNILISYTLVIFTTNTHKAIEIVDNISHFVSVLA